jgi:hypothetical protein
VFWDYILYFIGIPLMNAGIAEGYWSIKANVKYRSICRVLLIAFHSKIGMLNVSLAP